MSGSLRCGDRSAAFIFIFSGTCLRLLGGYRLRCRLCCEKDLYLGHLCGKAGFLRRYGIGFLDRFREQIPHAECGHDGNGGYRGLNVVPGTGVVFRRHG